MEKIFGDIDICVRDSENNELKLDKKYKFHVENLIKKSYENMEYVGETIEHIIREKLLIYNFGIKYTNFYAYLLREIMRNVIEHSESKEFYVCFYKNNLSKFGFRVVDNGIGIKKSLNRNPEYNVNDNKTALAFCIRPGITRSYKRDPYRDDVWQNSGFGLYMVSNIVNEIGGRFEISSENSRLIYKNSLREYKDEKKKIKGTDVLFILDTNNKFDTIQIIKEVSIRGNQSIKKYERFSKYATIKTASKASTLINK